MIDEIEGIARPLLRAVFWMGSLLHGVYRVVAVVPAAIGGAGPGRQATLRRSLPESRGG